VSTTKYVALLRGVNVGGNRKLPMAELRALCESLGFSDVATYIQSGNVILGSPRSEDEVVGTLERAIAERFGMASSVMVRTHDELAQILADNPFPEADTGTLHVAFLPKPVGGDVRGRLEEMAAPPEEFALNNREIYLHLPNGLGRSVLASAVIHTRRLGLPATVRNWRTVTKLADLSS
jgi:uncharacterized protein (DUF1697 family)